MSFTLFPAFLLALFLDGGKKNGSFFYGKKRIVPSKASTSSNNLTFNNLGSVLSASIQSAINSVVIIGGFVVLFSVIVSMLNSSKILNALCLAFAPIFKFFHIPEVYFQSIITGIIEVTNGVKMAAINTNSISIIISSFLLGFGGISVLFQVLSITSKAKISIKPYIIGKFIQACLSALLMAIIL